MDALLGDEKSANRSSKYIDELREVFRSHGMEVGGKDEIQSLCISVAVPGPIHDEITSIVRSIIYREREGISRPELLRLIIVAIAGSVPDEALGRTQEALPQLEQYVGKVIRAVRSRSFITDPEEVEPSPESIDATVEIFGGLAALSVETEKPFREINRSTYKLVPNDPVLAVPPPYLPLKAPAVVSEDPQLVPAYIVLNPVDSTKATKASSPVLASVIQPSTSRRAAWSIGMCVAILVMVAGLFWRHKPTAQSVANPPLVATSTSAPLGDSAVSPLQSVSGTRQLPMSPKPSASHPFSVSSPEVSSGQPASRSKPSKPSDKPFQEDASSGPRVPTKSVVPPSQSADRAPGLPPGARRASTLTANGSKPGSFLVSSGIMDGNLITTPTTPSYPMMANMTGIEGQVILQAVVSRTGTVVATHVLQGHRMLRSAASRAVRGWRYRPYLVQGKPTDIATIVIVDFHLHH